MCGETPCLLAGWQVLKAFTVCFKKGFSLSWEQTGKGRESVHLYTYANRNEQERQCNAPSPPPFHFQAGDRFMRTENTRVTIRKRIFRTYRESSGPI